MPKTIASFFSSESFMPHGHCFLWYPQILWLHVISDFLIAMAYYSIPLTLLYFARKRTDAPFKFLFYLFGAFILLCGTTHLMDIWVIWYPDYATQGVLKALTALASVFTAMVTWKIIPLALLLKSPTELENINNELKEAHASIERKVEERTLELRHLSEQLQREVDAKEAINVRLQDALRDAEAADRAKSEFLANMSHEIRTPMNAVVGLANLLQNNNLQPEKQREFIKTIQFSSQALMGLINDLLDIAKIENEVFELESVSFNLAELAEEIISIMSVRAKEKGVELFVKYDSRLKENFIGDPLRIRQILLNLISNGIKFTNKGAVTVHIDPAEHDKEGPVKVRFEVTDTGIGIVPDKLDTIFSKFSQVDTSITRKFGGTGLGLSICKTLVDLMGGTIGVVSTPGLGSRFTFELPMKPAESGNARKERRAKSGGEQWLEEGRQASILLVEDYRANVLVATSVIEDCGMRWDHAENGLEALEKFKSGKYDLILMDVQMPELDGISATVSIRAHESQHDLEPTPILGVTAYSQAEDRDKCLAAGMTDYLSKPFDTEVLKDKIRKLIKT